MALHGVSLEVLKLGGCLSASSSSWEFIDWVIRGDCAQVTFADGVASLFLQGTPPSAETGLELNHQWYEDNAVRWKYPKRKNIWREIQHSERGYRSGRRLSVDADEAEIFNYDHPGDGRFGRKRLALRLPPAPRGSIALKHDLEA
ncbi:hypothetical protein IW261DRAFT_1423383 [Armillaria novae-zelandiae]|uniref:Uncharacterized protein n=1 Tax=Armillaria novae-zelandiae TaxID=153914 RepID=A0AA39T9F8_9AGAR|nr:hypothetical protein IW261DRAFT_1423383 [Armillaria novae-zelandiae]